MIHAMKRFAILTICLVGLAPWCVAAADDVENTAEIDSLLAVVPADVGLAVEARDLHTALTTFAAGPMFARWKQYPPLAQWHADQEKQIEDFSHQLRKHLGISWDDLRSRLFGKQWVLAVYPPKSGDDKPDGILLVRAADAKLLANAAAKLFESQRAEDKYVGAVAVEIGKQSFTIHELRTEDRESLFVTYDGTFGALAMRRETLDRVLQLYTSDTKPADALLAAAEFQDAMRRIAPDAIVRAFARPADWAPPQKSGESENEQQRMAREVGEALTYVAAGIELEGVPRLEVHLGWNERKLPAVVREIVQSLQEADAAPPQIPADSLIAVSVHADLRRIADVVLKTVEQSTKSKSGPSVEAIIGARLLGSVGPGLVAYLSPAAGGPGTPYWLPVDWVVALDTRPIGAGPALVDTLDPLLRTVMSLAAEVVNTKHLGKAKLETFDVAPLQVTGLTGLGPTGDAGVFIARQAGRLWCGSSPAALAKGAGKSDAKSLANDPRFRRTRSPRLASSGQFAYVNFIEFRRQIDTVLAVVPPWLPAKQRPQFESSLGEMNRLLALVDAALVEVKVDAAGAGFSLSITVDEAPAARATDSATDAKSK